jgi:hypothetical protein
MSSSDTYSTTGERIQGGNTAERLFKLFVGNEYRHIKNHGPPVHEKGKWKLRSETINRPATLEHWSHHLYYSYILSIIPLLEDGTCWFACIDLDQYELDYRKIYDLIQDYKFPLLPVVSKNAGLHLFVFFKEPVSADLVRPVLHHMAIRLGFKKYEVFPTSAGEDKFTRAISMPYGNTWDQLAHQHALRPGPMLLEEFIAVAEKMRITTAELPEIPKGSPQQEARKIPLALQTAIHSAGPYPGGDRSPITASIIWQLRDLGFDVDDIKTAVEGRGPFTRYGGESNKSLEDDVARIISKYDLRHPNRKIASPLFMQSSAEFITNFVPPDYLIDGLIQRRFIYSMTGPTGEGKTSVALLLALFVDRGWKLDNREIDKGKVLFLAGENPDDVRMRWIKLLDDMKVDPDEVNVFFVPGSFTLSNKGLRDRIMKASEANGPFSLIIVDTSAAFFEGDDENVNTQMMAHAKMLRGLIDLIAGNPTVIVTSHPVKHFSRENMIPRGGGAFLNEMDGNLTCMKVDGTMVTELHWQGKFRGIDFGAISFRLEVGKTDKLKDSKGRHIWTVIARSITEKERDAAEDTGQKNKAQLLAAMAKIPGASLADLAKEVGWTTKDGKPYRSLVQRLLSALREDKLVKKESGRWVLTKAGIKAAGTVAAQEELEMPF